jgi:hypothetical protein
LRGRIGLLLNNDDWALRGRIKTPIELIEPT